MKPKPEGFIWRLRKNGNAIGGYLVEYGAWCDRPLGPTQRPQEFRVFIQKHFHDKKRAETELAEMQAKEAAKVEKTS